MIVKGFDLISDGRNGIKAKIEETNEKGRITVIDKVTKERSVPIPIYMRTAINSLKCYFLDITGHWLESWDSFMTSNKEAFADELTKDQLKSEEYVKINWLIDNTFITGCLIKEDGFLLKGRIRTIENKVVAMNTPLITSKDNYENFDVIMKKMFELNHMVKDYMENEQFLKQDARTYLLALAKSEKDKKAINDSSPDEIEERQLQDLEDRGIIIRMDSIKESTPIETKKVDVKKIEKKEEEKVKEEVLKQEKIIVEKKEEAIFPKKEKVAVAVAEGDEW